jgi:hypothetical protein
MCVFFVTMHNAVPTQLPGHPLRVRATYSKQQAARACGCSSCSAAHMQLSAALLLLLLVLLLLAGFIRV